MYVSFAEKRKHVLWLQWLLVVAVCYLLHENDPEPRYVFSSIDLIILASMALNIPLFYLPRRYFDTTAVDYVLVFCDVIFVSVAIYLTGQAISDLYLFFFWILILAATSQNLRALVAGVLASSGLYTLMVWKTGEFTWTSGFLLRIPFLFIVGLFFGYLVLLQKQKEERLKAESEFTVDLFEFGKALAQANDLEILYARIPRLIKAIMGTDACELVIIEEGHIVQRIFQNRFDQDFPYIDVKKSVHKKAFDSAEPFSSPDVRKDPDFSDKEDFALYSHPAYMGKSWKIHARLSGVLALYQKEAYIWTEHDLKKFQFLVDQAVLALQHARLLQELESQARTDGLTGLANHRYFHERLDEELSRARRKHYSLSVIMMDVDHFKRINDTYGHRAGDDILRSLATLFKTTTRRMDIVARYGGDEFGIVCPETSADQVQILCQRILDGFSRLEFGEVADLSISIGSASFPNDGQTASRLIENADQALYHVKAEGRNRASQYSATLGVRSAAT